RDGGKPAKIARELAVPCQSTSAIARFHSRLGPAYHWPAAKLREPRACASRHSRFAQPVSTVLHDQGLPEIVRRLQSVYPHRPLPVRRQPVDAQPVLRHLDDPQQTMLQLLELCRRQTALEHRVL